MKKVNQLMAERASARDFDPDYQIKPADLQAVLDSVRMAPTSYGLLNYWVLVLPKSEFRDQLNDVFYNQKNFVHSSVILLFIADKGEKIRSKTIYKTADLIFDHQDFVDKKAKFISNFHQTYEYRYWNEPKLADEWSAKQVYLGLGVATVAAAEVGLDTCVFEGINEARLTKILVAKKIIDANEMIVVGMAVGKRIDQYAPRKIRREYSEFVKIVE